MKKIIKLMMVGLVVVALTVGCSAEDTEEYTKEDNEKALEKIDEAETYEAMERDKEGLLGKHVKFSGRVLQVIDGDGFMQYRLATHENYRVGMDDNRNRVILAEIDDSTLKENILKDDEIAIEGTSAGFTKYENYTGEMVKVPAVIVDTVKYATEEDGQGN